MRDLLDAETGTLVVSAFVLAELDYLLMSRAGIHAELTLVKDLADDVYQVAGGSPGNPGLRQEPAHGTLTEPASADGLSARRPVMAAPDARPGRHSCRQAQRGPGLRADDAVRV